MKRSIILISGIFFAICLGAQNYSDTLTMELTKHFNLSDLPGCSVSLVSENEVLYENSFGFANKENQINFESSTILNLGSVTKTVVGLALVKAIADGKLTMDRHLANHTSSIRDSKHYGKTYILGENFVENENTHQGFLGFLKSHTSLEMKDFIFNILNKKGDWYRKKNFSKMKPGTHKEYSNLNAALTAYIIEIATEMPFEEYTQIKIFDPLGMQSTSWTIKKEQIDKMATRYFPAGKQVPNYRLITYPDGGLYSNTTDLSKYLMEMIKAYSGNSTYLPLEYAKLMLPGDDDNNRTFWGIRKKNRTIGHEGSDPGTQTDLRFKADRKIGRIILTNVNAEDNEIMYQQYRGIHDILSKYEDKLIP